MLKIFTILVLFQFLISSALPEKENDNGGNNFQPRLKKHIQQDLIDNDELHDHGFQENEANPCSRNENSNDNKHYEVPANEFEIFLALNPESQRDSLSTTSPNEVYFKNYNKQPNQNSEFDDQKEPLKKTDDSTTSPHNSFEYQISAPVHNQLQSYPESQSTSNNDDFSNHAYNSETVRNEEVNNERESTEKNNQNKAESAEQRQTESVPVQDCPLSPQSNRRANNDNFISQEVLKTDDINNAETETKQAGRYYPIARPYTRYPYSPLSDPASQRVKALSAAGVNLLEYSRVCYACTSANNPTCVQPNRRTTVKYCLKGHDSCVTKTYQTGKDKDSLVLIRDCGMSCDDTEVPGYKYKSCKVCHSDVCNDDPFSGAYTIQSQSFILTLFIIFVIKHVI